MRAHSTTISADCTKSQSVLFGIIIGFVGLVPLFKKGIEAVTAYRSHLKNARQLNQEWDTSGQFVGDQALHSTESVSVDQMKNSADGCTRNAASYLVVSLLVAIVIVARLLMSSVCSTGFWNISRFDCAPSKSTHWSDEPHACLSLQQGSMWMLSFVLFCALVFWLVPRCLGCCLNRVPSAQG